jgi:ribonuclease HII
LIYLQNHKKDANKNMTDIQQPQVPDTARFVAGVDEAGRGPLAGPVVAAAVILDPEVTIDGLQDSKKLSARRRQELAEIIRRRARSWCVARADVAEIDEINILQATMRAMHRAVDGLEIPPDYVLVDGNRVPDWEYHSQPVIRGDQIVDAISAASILAKVTRDEEMINLNNKYPGYGFESHKGYPTKSHIEAIQALGITPEHRRSFAPVRKAIEGK